MQLLCLARENTLNLVRKTRKRTWCLRHLKKAGFNSEELVKVYCAMIRPLLEYCSVVFHTLISNEESDKLDRLERQALKSIYGRKLSYSKMLTRSGLVRLSERRQDAFDGFC